MRCTRRTIGMVTAGLLALPVFATSASADAGWTEEAVPQPDSGRNSLTSVLGGETTWAFGGYAEAKDPAATRAYQRDAAGTWTEQPIPDVGSIGESVALAPDDVWVLGSAGHPPLHWDGARWTAFPAPDADAGLTSLTVIGGEVWAGGTSTGVAQENTPIALRWDGGAWTGPAVPLDQLTYGQDVTGSGPDDVWLSGSRYVPDGNREVAVTLRWDGAAWTPVALPDIADLRLRDMRAVAADDVWAVGAAGTPSQERPVTLHWNGAAWTEVATPGTGSLDELLDVGGELWATGFGNVLRFDGTAWQPVEGVPAGAGIEVAALPGGETLAVGSRALGPYRSESVAAVLAAG